jgi:hypothetical protein
MRPDGVVRADGSDTAVAYGQAARPRSSRVHRGDPATEEHEVGGAIGRHEV